MRFWVLFIASIGLVSFTWEMLKLSRIVLIAVFLGLLPVDQTMADGWRFWKRKTTVDDQGKKTAGPVEKQTIDRAQTDRRTVEKQIRAAQKARAKAEKERQEDMAKALKKKEREMLKQQKDVKKKQEKIQREQQRKMKGLSKSYQGKRSWKFWKKSDSSSDFFLPQ